MSIVGIHLEERDQFPSRFSLTDILQRWWLAYISWRIERAAALQLYSMSDRELKDIGLSRSGVPGALREASCAAKPAPTEACRSD